MSFANQFSSTLDDVDFKLCFLNYALANIDTQAVVMTNEALFGLSVILYDIREELRKITNAEKGELCASDAQG